MNNKGWRRIVIDGKSYSAYRLLVFLLQGRDITQERWFPKDGNWNNLTLGNGYPAVPVALRGPDPNPA
jgi:hypothetical protein